MGSLVNHLVLARILSPALDTFFIFYFPHLFKQFTVNNKYSVKARKIQHWVFFNIPNVDLVKVANGYASLRKCFTSEDFSKKARVSNLAAIMSFSDKN